MIHPQRLGYASKVTEVSGSVVRTGSFTPNQWSRASSHLRCMQDLLISNQGYSRSHTYQQCQHSVLCEQAGWPHSNQLCQEAINFWHLCFKKDISPYSGTLTWCSESVSNTYYVKWKYFSVWSLARGIQLKPVRIQDILDYLLHFKSSGLSLSSLRVCLVEISTFQPQFQGNSVFF